MSPLFQKTLESKAARRQRLMALPYPEKVRIVEQMRAAALEIRQAENSTLILREEPSPYGGGKA
ncbi:MAG: hypothetical protein K9N47_28650 [Prosthecobacter sp.]|uniref:hypothetical protein n=1 Tax=Prosthecobacter sp. TaxID=1965333 RepID=UPI0026386528|nr:hypothetical protein [Prosthecobacter sp.]MCF7790122.1 hypothetical protein [Prosthecobacter sp.]